MSNFLNLQNCTNSIRCINMSLAYALSGTISGFFCFLILGGIFTTRIHHKRPVRFIIYIVISNLLVDVVRLVNYGQLNNATPLPFSCQFSGFLTTLTNDILSGWITATTIYLVLLSVDHRPTSYFEIFCHVVIWPSAIAVASVGFAFDGMSWFTPTRNPDNCLQVMTGLGKIYFLQIEVFAVMLCVLLVCLIFVFLLVRDGIIYALRKRGVDVGKRGCFLGLEEKSKKAFRVLFPYPLFILAGWVWVVTARLAQITNWKSDFFETMGEVGILFVLWTGFFLTIWIGITREVFYSICKLGVNRLRKRFNNQDSEFL
eukprot:TRINITY_DN23448_c0_g1_i1.p1 TRINITY_DN23448_c0_g1~~TRINITY_DN23448_c0_g1_i1.p1  ORF type:complete len:315 (-),score=38.24 TRINITY_DN23448_c0_g1_i1:13-957(-)